MKVFLVKATQTDTIDYYVKAKNQKEAEKLVKKLEYSEDVVYGCSKTNKFEIIETRECTKEDIIHALFNDC